MAQVLAGVVMTAGLVTQMGQVSGRLVTGSLDLALSAAGGLARLASASVSRWREHPAVRAQLQGLDIEVKVETVQALLLTVRRRAIGEDETDVIHVSLRRVGETLQEITAALEKVDAELALHETRWLSSWRNPDTEPLVGEIKRLVLILDERVNFLLKCYGALVPPQASAGVAPAAATPTAATTTPPPLGEGGFVTDMDGVPPPPEYPL